MGDRIRGRPGKGWRVIVVKNADRIGCTWSAWIDLPNGYSATTYSPETTKPAAERVARHFRQGMNMVDAKRKR